MLKAFHLRDLPLSGRIMLTAFLAIVGAGYLFGVANIFMYHRAADGDPRLTLNDLKAVYSGITVAPDGTPAPPRMLEMIDTSMRKYLQTDEEYQTLRAWLTAGAASDAFEKSLPPADVSPHDILSDRCVRCHNPEGEQAHAEARQSPFGPDLFTVKFAMVEPFTTVPTTQPAARRVGPQSAQRLILISHVHMLSIPVFTLITSLLMMLTHVRPAFRGPLVCIPMLTLVVDFTGWWVARSWPATIWLIAGSGPLYSVTYAAQLFAVFGSMWFGRRRMD